MIKVLYFSLLKRNDGLANYKCKGLNVIFNGVSTDQIKLITTCECKKVWEVLQTAYEGTSDVKRSKLLLLTNKDEELHVTCTVSRSDLEAHVPFVVFSGIISSFLWHFLLWREI